MTTGDEIRALMRRAETASLATALAAHDPTADGPGDTAGSAWPYASLVLSCLDHAGCPLLLLSDLAEHTQNLKRDPRAALLFDATPARADLQADPLTGARATLLGRVARLDDPALAAPLLERFVRRHPGAAVYRGFADFALYRLVPERAHLVAGFGKIAWVAAETVLLAAAETGTLDAAEADIVAHMNQDHGDALALMAAHRLDWRESVETPPRLVGVDPEGADLRAGPRLGRIDFAKPVRDAQACRAELVRLTKEARRAAAASR